MLRLISAALIFAGVLGSYALAQQDPKGEASSSVPVAPVRKLSAAEMRAQELDKLFGQLLTLEAGSGNPHEIESRIWAIWMRSDSVTGELILAQATKAMNAEEYDTSLQMLNELAAAMPDFSEVFNKRAGLLYKMRRYDQAMADIDRALELEPRHFGALTGRGMILEKQGKTDAALAAFREALQMNPHMPLVKETVKVMQKERPEL